MTTVKNIRQLNLQWLIAISFILGLSLFFANPRVPILFANPAALAENIYCYFAATIFQPNYSFYAESILLPLNAKAIGATSSSYSFWLLCVVVTTLILPNVAYWAQTYFQNINKSLLLVLAFALCFRYLHFFDLGTPDPLTILLITIVGLSRAPKYVFLASLFAGLSHFSVASLGICACTILVFFAPSVEKKVRHRLASVMILGLIAAKIILVCWFFVFKYKLNSRLDIVLDLGVRYFYQEVWPDPLEFLFVPGAPFVALYLAILLLFIFSKNVLFGLAMLAGPVSAYVGLFFSVDGLRVFAPIIVGSLLIVLREAIEAYYSDKIANEVRRYFSACFSFLLRLRLVFFGVLTASAWLILTLRAKSNGLLINEAGALNTAIGQIGYMELYLWVVALIVGAVIAIPKAPTMQKFISLVKVLVIIPLLIILFQFLRLKFFPVTTFSTLEKLVILGVMGLLGAGAYKVDVSTFITRIVWFLCQLKNLVSHDSSSKR